MIEAGCSVGVTERRKGGRPPQPILPLAALADPPRGRVLVWCACCWCGEGVGGEGLRLHRQIGDRRAVGRCSDREPQEFGEFREVIVVAAGKQKNVRVFA